MGFLTPTWNLSKSFHGLQVQDVGILNESPLSAQQCGDWYCHLNVLCLTLRLGSFYVQSLIIRGGKGSESRGRGVLVTHPLPSHRTKEFIEEFTVSSSWDCYILTGLHLGVGENM